MVRMPVYQDRRKSPLVRSNRGEGPWLCETQCCCDFPVILLEESMRRFIEEADRGQWTLLPECLDDFIDESNADRSSGKQAFIGGETHFRQ